MKAANPRRRHGIYLLPNLFTTASLFSGFLSIIFATDGHYANSAMAILVCVLLDSLDGRIARMTGTESEFGMNYDSLTDGACFGLAPALLVHQFLLHEYGKAGWIAAFLFAAAATLRLARFNAQAGSFDKRYFQGLPSPAAAALLACFIWLAAREQWSPQLSVAPLFLLTIGSAALMVSTLRYHSFKLFHFAGKVRFLTAAAITLILALIALKPYLVLFLIFLFYTISGILITLNEKRKLLGSRRRAAKSKAEPQAPPEESTGESASSTKNKTQKKQSASARRLSSKR